MSFCFDSYEQDSYLNDEEGNSLLHKTKIYSPKYKEELLIDLYPSAISLDTKYFDIPEKELYLLEDEYNKKAFRFYQMGIVRRTQKNDYSFAHQICEVSDECIESLFLLTPDEFPGSFYLDFEVHQSKRHLFTRGTLIKTTKNIYLRLFRPLELSKWNYPFNVKTFCTYIEENFKFDGKVVYSENFQNIGVLLKLGGSDSAYNINDKISVYGKSLLAFCENSLIDLAQGKSIETLVKVFNFPPQFETICTQYVLWFGEFLSSLGLKVKISSLQSDKNTTFVINPDEDRGLTEDIEKLFYAYLGLPASESLVRGFNELVQYNTEEYIGKQVQHHLSQIEDKILVIKKRDANDNALSFDISSEYEFMVLDSLEDEKKYEFFDQGVSIPSKQSFFKNKNITFDISKIIGFFKPKLELKRKNSKSLEDKSQHL